MDRYHKIASLICSVGFIVVVQLFATPTPNFKFLIPAFLSFLAIVGFYNYSYLKKKSAFDWWVWLRMILFLVGWFFLFLLVPSNLTRGMFLIIGLGLVYFFESMVAALGEQMLFTIILATAFGFSMAFFALEWYFLVPSFYALLVVFAAMVVLVRSSYATTPVSQYVQWAGSIAIALFMTELFWALTFWPLHYSALAVILFSVFYFCWGLYYYYLFNHVTIKKIQFHLALSLIFIAAILLVTPWSIIK